MRLLIYVSSPILGLIFASILAILVEGSLKIHFLNPSSSYVSPYVNKGTTSTSTTTMASPVESKPTLSSESLKAESKKPTNRTAEKKGKKSVPNDQFIEFKNATDTATFWDPDPKDIVDEATRAEQIKQMNMWLSAENAPEVEDIPTPKPLKSEPQAETNDSAKAEARDQQVQASERRMDLFEMPSSKIIWPQDAFQPSHYKKQAPLVAPVFYPAGKTYAPKSRPAASSSRVAPSQPQYQQQVQSFAEAEDEEEEVTIPSHLLRSQQAEAGVHRRGHQSEPEKHEEPRKGNYDEDDDEKTPSGSLKPPPCTQNGYYCTFKEDYPLDIVTEVTKYYKWPLEKLFRDLRTNQLPTLANESPGELVCDSITRVLRPGWSRNVKGRWLVVINTEHYEQFVTEIICTNGSGSRCNFIPPCYYATCEQRFNVQKLLVIDPWNPYKGPFISEFLFPSCCVCHVPSVAVAVGSRSHGPSSHDEL